VIGAHDPGQAFLGLDDKERLQLEAIEVGIILFGT
jgi:hypothetical protein